MQQYNSKLRELLTYAFYFSCEADERIYVGSTNQFTFKTNYSQVSTMNMEDRYFYN